VCTSGAYARKHAPWVNSSNVPGADSVPFTSFPSSSNFASLPTLSFVIPNLNDDMHDGTVAQGDTWLQNNLSAYATCAKANNSLLVVT
jgi:acid phosphatase